MAGRDIGAMAAINVVRSLGPAKLTAEAAKGVRLSERDGDIRILAILGRCYN
jgi:hypothetical protein